MRRSIPRFLRFLLKFHDPGRISFTRPISGILHLAILSQKFGFITTLRWPRPSDTVHTLPIWLGSCFRDHGISADTLWLSPIPNSDIHRFSESAIAISRRQGLVTWNFKEWSGPADRSDDLVSFDGPTSTINLANWTRRCRCFSMQVLVYHVCTRASPVGALRSGNCSTGVHLIFR